jgi:DNA polymerase-3 subunit epsilon/ATP-dependent DNA helicase DinG
VIARLPFDVPTDPVFAARAETFEDPFYEYAVPQAVLRLRQGFGRLIRRTTDRGVVTILDRRVLTRSYGPTFLDALPAAARRLGPVHGLATTAARFLAGEPLPEVAPAMAADWYNAPPDPGAGMAYDDDWRDR